MSTVFINENLQVKTPSAPLLTTGEEIYADWERKYGISLKPLVKSIPTKISEFFSINVVPGRLYHVSMSDLKSALDILSETDPVYGEVKQQVVHNLKWEAYVKELESKYPSNGGIPPRPIPEERRYGRDHGQSYYHSGF